MELTVERLKELLYYDPETGKFSRLVSNSNRVKVGDIAGTLNSRGYLQIQIDGKLYKAHRLAWLYTHKAWPADQIDHVNRDRTDNRISNLREASSAENSRNMGKRYDNTSGHVGLTWDKRAQKWKAQIKHLHRNVHLGLFTRQDDAVAARQAAEVRYWGAVRTL